MLGQIQVLVHINAEVLLIGCDRKNTRNNGKSIHVAWFAEMLPTLDSAELILSPQVWTAKMVDGIDNRCNFLRYLMYVCTYLPNNV